MVTLTACHRHEAKPVELWLGGDVNLGDGGRAQLRSIAGIVQGAFGIVNLEGPVSDRLPLKGKLRLWNAPRALAELLAVNVRVAGIANNHAEDAGGDGAIQTATVLRQHGILPTGRVAGPAFFHVGDLSIAVTAHDLTPGGDPIS
jgi:hypothetical protein